MALVGQNSRPRLLFWRRHFSRTTALAGCSASYPPAMALKRSGPGQAPDGSLPPEAGGGPDHAVFRIGPPIGVLLAVGSRGFQERAPRRLPSGVKRRQQVRLILHRSLGRG